MNSKIVCLLMMLPWQLVHARFFVDLNRVAVADHERWYPLFQPVELDQRTQLNDNQTQLMLSALDQRFGTTGSREILQILRSKFGNSVPRLTPLSASELLFNTRRNQKISYRLTTQNNGLQIFESPSPLFPNGRIKHLRLNASIDQIEVVAAIVEQALTQYSFDHVNQAVESLGNSYQIAKDLAQKLQIQKVSSRMVPKKMALQVAETPSPHYPNGRVITLAYAKPAGMDEDFEGAGRNMILAVQVEKLVGAGNWSVDQLQKEIGKLGLERPYQVPRSR